MPLQDTFIPVAKTLVDLGRIGTCNLIRVDSTYDPAVGEVVEVETIYAGFGAVMKRWRDEAGGTGEDYRLEVWMDHQTTNYLPETKDRVSYDGRTWKVISVNPTYSGDALVASKLTCAS